LDSTLCISYLTIEFRSVIPRALRPKMGNHIFGCDDCQDCCPWNERFSRETNEAAYRSMLDRQAPRLSDMATLTEAQFHERFAGTAVLRTTYPGFLRNVAVALGNWRDEAALDALSALLHHAEPLVRLHAAWGMGQIGNKDAMNELNDLLKRETDATVREEAREMLTAPIEKP
jgi:epoxyqueuosine reductase